MRQWAISQKLAIDITATSRTSLIYILVFIMTTTLAGPASAVKWIDGKTATLQALDKITARISTVAVPVGVSKFFGTLEITVDRCAFHPPEEPPESVAFITIRDVGYGDHAPKQIFAGWMFASSPAVSALEHPVYDVTVLACNVN
jgi:hypothetical protein